MYNNPYIYPYRKSNYLYNLKNINFSEILNSTQKTLNIINQAIPIFYQIKPLWNNTKIILNIAKEVNKKEEPIKENKIDLDIKKENKNYNEPIFFI